MAKSTRKAAARRAPKGAASSRTSKPASRGAAAQRTAMSGASSGTTASSRAASSGAASPRAASSRAASGGGASGTAGASRWSRGKPVAKRKVASVRPTRVAPAPLAIRDPSHEEIAHHAYLRWLAHGGSEHDNWYAAEHELRTRRNALRASRTMRSHS